MTGTRYVVLAAMVAVTLVGCGPKGGPPPNMSPVGTWEHTAGSHPGDYMADYQMALNISSDSTFTLDVSGNKSKGSWALVGNLLTLTYSEVDGTVPGDGNTAVLAMSASGQSIQTISPVTVFDRVGN